MKKIGNYFLKYRCKYASMALNGVKTEDSKKTTSLRTFDINYLR